MANMGWGRLAIGVGLGFLAVALLATADGSEGAKEPAQSAQLGMLVRLHQLAPGFVVDEETGCGTLDPEGAEPPLFEFIVHHFPRACKATYERAYAVRSRRPDPPLATSAVFDFRGPAVALEAEAVLPELLSRATGNEVPAESPTVVSLGQATRLFHGSALVRGHGAPASIITWRQGRLIGMTLAGGQRGEPADREAVRLARLQRGHMRRPTPYPAAQRDDVLVPLDNPAIAVPVYWLGRSFDLGGDSKSLSLTRAAGPLREGEAPTGTRVELEYGGGALRIGIWTAASWRRYLATRLGSEFLAWRCTRTSNLPVPGGDAKIFRGYTKDYDSCPDSPPEVFAAVVERGRVVIGVNLPLCYTCLEPGGARREELETAVRGLRLRPQRRFRAES
jgi:hypothetical protein